MEVKLAVFVFTLKIQLDVYMADSRGDNSLYFVAGSNVEEYTFYLYYPLIKTGGLYL